MRQIFSKPSVFVIKSISEFIKMFDDKWNHVYIDIATEYIIEKIENKIVTNPGP
jgi:hypothetical protein